MLILEVSQVNCFCLLAIFEYHLEDTPSCILLNIGWLSCESKYIFRSTSSCYFQNDSIIIKIREPNAWLSRRLDNTSFSLETVWSLASFNLQGARSPIKCWITPTGTSSANRDNVFYLSGPVITIYMSLDEVLWDRFKVFPNIHRWAAPTFSRSRSAYF